MRFDIIDNNVSATTNIFLIIANIINLSYNIPQMYKTYKCKSTKDFSGLFLLLRVVGNCIWIEYAIEINSMLMLINNIVTVISSLFIGYYKLNEILKKNPQINDMNIELQNNDIISYYMENKEKEKINDMNIELQNNDIIEKKKLLN